MGHHQAGADINRMQCPRRIQGVERCTFTGNAHDAAAAEDQRIISLACEHVIGTQFTGHRGIRDTVHDFNLIDGGVDSLDQFRQLRIGNVDEV